jgi:hypothetical protein
MWKQVVLEGLQNTTKVPQKTVPELPKYKTGAVLQSLNKTEGILRQKPQ